jgi:hypothetical protein
MASDALREAFERVCREARPAEGWYVALLERVPYYGGPEEGGWWGEDVVVVAYRHYDTEEAARAAAAAVERLASELARQARSDFGRHCLAQTEWLEARGLEDGSLPEVDGEVSYLVTVTAGPPESTRGSRRWE